MDEEEVGVDLEPDRFFKVLKECAQSIDKKVAQIEDELICPSLFGDPMKAVASESFVNRLIEDVLTIKESIKKLTEDTKKSLLNQQQVIEELSSARDSVFQQIIDTENHLEKFGYKRLEEISIDLPLSEVTDCSNSTKNDDTEVSYTDMVPLDSEDGDLGYQACLTPLITEKKTAQSTSKIYSSKKLIESKCCELEGSQDLSEALKDEEDDTYTYSAAFYELEKKFKMSKV